jgi:hypothetical protein
MLRRGRAGLAAFSFCLFANGCASTASSYLGDPSLTIPEITEVIGSFHDEFGGIHLVGTLSLFKAGRYVSTGAPIPIQTLRFRDWRIDFEASNGFAPQVRQWIRESQTRLERDFRAFVDFAYIAYPRSGSRHFTIIVLPPASSFDRSWRYLATSDRNLHLTFALPLEAAKEPPAIGKSVEDVFPILAHEFSHSYFWFHPKGYRNNFSDEVIAYTTERCVAWKLSGRSPMATPSGPRDVDSIFGRLTPFEMFSRFEGRYPDTVLAPFVAANEFRRILNGGGAALLDTFCQSLPLSGVDFTIEGRVAAKTKK